MHCSSKVSSSNDMSLLRHGHWPFDCLLPSLWNRLRTNVKYLLNFCLFNSAWWYGLVLERSHRQSIMQKRLVKPELIFLAPLFVCLFFFSFSVLLRKHPDFEAKTQCLSALAGVSAVQFVVHYCSQHHRYQLKKTDIIMIMVFCRSWKVIQIMKLDSDL